MPNNQYNRIDDNGLLYLLTLLKPVIEAAGEDNVIEKIQKNGVDLTISGKTVNITVPTDTDIEALITAHGYQTGTDVSTAIDAALAEITGFEFELVDELPATGKKGVIYLIPNGSTAANAKDEYIWVIPEEGAPYFEQIGSTEVDLSGYVQATEMHSLTNTEIDAIFQQVWS